METMVNRFHKSFFTRVFSKCKICDSCKRYRYRLRRASRLKPTRTSSKLVLPGQFVDTRNQLYYLSVNQEDNPSKVPSKEEIEEEKPVCSKTIKKEKQVKPKKEKARTRPVSVVDCIANYYKSAHIMS